MIIKIKPLSQNEAWQGRRFKSEKYINFEKSLFFKLKKMDIPEGKIEINYAFGFSNKLSDIDNPVKSFQDVLCRVYRFNDRDIYRITIDKEIVQKGKEFIKFEIKPFKELLSDETIKHTQTE